MDVVTILGIRRVDFVTEDGVNINGLSLYYSYHDDGVDGVAADKVFVADRHLRRSNKGFEAFRND